MSPPSCPQTSRTLLVAAALLVNTRREILLTQRPEGKALAGLWEFPGGKVEPHESPEMALIRELEEEIGIRAASEDLTPLAFASQEYDAFHLLMPLYTLFRWEGTVTGREGQACRWVSAEEMTDYPMPPADLPLIALIRSRLSAS